MSRGCTCTTLVVVTHMASALGAGCYSPPEPDCGFFCGSGGACPSDYTCGEDQRCHLAGSPVGECATKFSVTNAQSTFVTTLIVSFSDTPDPVSASEPANYAIGELALADSLPQVIGNTVSLTTAPQLAQLYTLQVANVTRLSDGQPIDQTPMSFVGRSSFNLIAATAPNATTVDLTFDAAPAPTQVFCLSNYFVGVIALDAQLDNSSIELTTGIQGGEALSAQVNNIVRASDGEALSNGVAPLQLTTAFGVLSMVAINTTSVEVTFTDPVQTASAATLANYVITDGSGSAQLPIVAPPVPNGTTVLLSTAPQRRILYDLVVTGVVRASDGEMLEAGQTTAAFLGIDHCTDGVLDGNETDVDCGGPDCAKCAANKMCLRGSDCTSGTCTANRCT